MRLVHACGRGGLPDRYHPHRTEGAVEALAECPSLPLGWKTGTAALRSGGVVPQGFPDVPGQGLDPAQPVNVPAVDG
jgi:hypothetical protein